MSVVQQLEAYLVNTKQNQKIEEFQKQYNQMLTAGLIQRKGYTLADLNVTGERALSSQKSGIAVVATSYNR